MFLSAVDAVFTFNSGCSPPPPFHLECDIGGNRLGPISLEGGVQEHLKGHTGGFALFNYTHFPQGIWFFTNKFPMSRETFVSVDASVVYKSICRGHCSTLTQTINHIQCFISYYIILMWLCTCKQGLDNTL